MATQILPPVLKPIYLVPLLGEYAVLPDGAIINVGGVEGPSFTVAGKPLLFADGTSTDGSPTGGFNANFQTVYQNSGSEAVIDFTSGKDMVWQAVNDKLFRFDADTGDVFISGNLVVQGTTTTIINSQVITDRVEIRQSAGTYIPFLMEPTAGITPAVDVVDIKIAYGGASVFTISPTGVVHAAELTVNTINGVDISALALQVQEHVSPVGIKHTAEQISVNTAGLQPISGSNVQEALESIQTALSTVSSAVRAYEHVQLIPSDTWTITHGGNSRKVQITIWDNTDELLYSDSTSIQDFNTVIVRYGTPVTGRAILMLF